MKSSLFSVAVSGAIALSSSLAFGAGENTPTQDAKMKSADMGECHGINSCKGTGACGGKGHSCAGKNSCKGKGWLKLSKADCTAKKGKFKAEKMENQ